ncbi:hypothetical protein ACFQT0_17705 [Hymenobacter humi]|uniref:Signal transduction histidine kinase dimerisation/phosphoacceptor domain-containing protein n=1 Tax=Hymenobacter humi TaxID=1411620 RepID=A0ABW2UA33_9BACT
METTAAGLGAKLIDPVVRLWQRLINIGVQPSLTDWQRKRVHLLNGISAVTIAIYAGYVLVFFNSPDYMTFRICLFGVFLNLPPFFFNYYHRYDAAAYYCALSVTVLCSFIAIARKYDGVEYYLISNSIVPMLFFRNFWKIFVLFCVNVAAFFAVRHGMTVIEPFLYVPNSQYFYKANVLLCFLTLFVVVYYFRLENFRQEQMLTEKNETLERSLENLQNTQTRLVQQEKLASLGALTAGIAHEIQNPLNFVDNFSEVGLELVQELRDEPGPRVAVGARPGGRRPAHRRFNPDPAESERARRPGRQHREKHAAALAHQQRPAPAHRPQPPGRRIPALGLPRLAGQARRLYRRPFHRL